MDARRGFEGLRDERQTSEIVDEGKIALLCEGERSESRSEVICPVER